MSKRMKTVQALLLFGEILITVAPAEARRRFRFIPLPGVKSESIEMVRDLPDTEAFRKDGKYYDLGYLNGRRRESYVLYHGSLYIILDKEGIATLTAMLGSDPTAGHRHSTAVVTEDPVAAAKKAEMIESGQMIERNPGESFESYQTRMKAFAAQHKSSSAAPAEPDSEALASDGSSAPGIGGFGLIVLMVIGLGMVGPRMLRKLLSSRNGTSGVTDTPTATDTLSFDERVAARLRELESGGQPEPVTSAATKAPATPVAFRPAPVGFGHRGL